MVDPEKELSEYRRQSFRVFSEAKNADTVVSYYDTWAERYNEVCMYNVCDETGTRKALLPGWDAERC